MYKERISKLQDMFEDLTKRSNEGSDLANAERAKVYEELVRLRRLQWEHDHDTVNFELRRLQWEHDHDTVNFDEHDY